MSKSLQEAARDALAAFDAHDPEYPGAITEVLLSGAMDDMRSALAAEQGQPTREDLIAALDKLMQERERSNEIGQRGATSAESHASSLLARCEVKS